MSDSRLCVAMGLQLRLFLLHKAQHDAFNREPYRHQIAMSHQSLNWLPLFKANTAPPTTRNMARIYNSDFALLLVRNTQ